jgi:hypothetical protein
MNHREYLLMKAKAEFHGSTQERCIACGALFEISGSDHARYLAQRMTPPHRCHDCRDKRRISQPTTPPPEPPPPDAILQCVDCGGPYYMAGRERSYFRDRHLRYPRRCRPCRARRREASASEQTEKSHAR